jgi:hypothetical protein
MAFAKRLTDGQDLAKGIMSGKGYLLTDGLKWYDAKGKYIDECAYGKNC